MKKTIAITSVLVIMLSFVPSFYAEAGPAVDPIYHKGNDNKDLDELVPDGYVYYKLDSGGIGTHILRFNESGAYSPDGTIEVKITIEKSSVGYTYISHWSSNIKLYSLIVKGGNAYNLYKYSDNYDEDQNLVSPVNPSGKPADISHVSIVFNPCLYEPEPTPTPTPTPSPSPACSAINHGDPKNPKFASTEYSISNYAGTGIGGFNGENGSSAPGIHSPATNSEVHGPRGLSIDKDGNLYIADEKNGAVRLVLTNNKISTVTGNGTGNAYTPADFTGPAYGKGMYEPMDVVVAPCGKYVLFLDTDNHIVRLIDQAGNLRTIAGILEIGSAGGYSDGDGTALKARFNSPQGIAVDLNGNIYVADTNNHIIRKITKDGRISNIAGYPGIGGYSGDGGPAERALLNNPVGLAFDTDGSNLYIADTFNHRIRMINIATGIITTVAGSGNLPTNSATEDGVRDNIPAEEASLFFPHDIALDAADNLYIADSANHRIRKVLHDTNIITTIAGTGFMGFSGTNGAATSAALNRPKGVAVDFGGNVYVSDTENNIIRRLTPH